MTLSNDDDIATHDVRAHPSIFGFATANRTPRAIEAEVGILTGEITSRGRRVACTSTEVALLGFLALHDGDASAETIAAALWPDRSLQAARNVLWAAVQHVRRRLTDAAIETSPHGYRLGSALRCDVRTAEKLLAIAAAAPASVDAMALKLHGYFDALRSERYRRIASPANAPTIEARLRALGIGLASVLIEHECLRRNAAGAVTILDRLVASAPDHAETAAFAAATYPRLLAREPGR